MRTQEQEESYEMHVFRDAMDERHGHFVNMIIEAVQVADAENFELMRPFLRAFIRRYGLECSDRCERDGTGWTGQIPDWVKNPPKNMAREAREKLDGASKLLAEHGFVQSHKAEMDDFAGALQLLDRIAGETY